MRRQLRAADVANALRMVRTHYRAKTFLIVEGDDDRALFAWHIDTTRCQVEPCYGRDKVIETILILDGDTFPGVLGIVDADYTVLEAQQSGSANILVTDHHDAECMLLASPALEHTLHELGTQMDIEAFESRRGCSVLSHLHAIGSSLGYLRWASSRHGWGLRFEGIDFSKFVSRTTFELDAAAMLDTVRGQQGGRDSSPPTIEVLSAATQELAATNADPWHVCRGHDLVEILSIGLQRVVGSRNENEVKPERLELMLRLAFEKSHFTGTTLYARIRAWETANQPFKILQAT